MRQVIWLVLLCAAVSAAILPVHGQVKAYTQPISRDTVVLRLTIGTEPARIGVQNGAMARVALKNGPTLGLVPVIRGSAVDLILVEIRVDPLTANEGVRQLASRRLEKGPFSGTPRVAPSSTPSSSKSTRRTPNPTGRPVRARPIA